MPLTSPITGLAAGILSLHMGCVQSNQVSKVTTLQQLPGFNGSACTEKSQILNRVADSQLSDCSRINLVLIYHDLEVSSEAFNFAYSHLAQIHIW